MDSHNKGHSILGSILGSPYFGKVPFELQYIGMQGLEFGVKVPIMRVYSELWGCLIW